MLIAEQNYAPPVADLLFVTWTKTIIHLNYNLIFHENAAMFSCGFASELLLLPVSVMDHINVVTVGHEVTNFFSVLNYLVK